MTHRTKKGMPVTFYAGGSNQAVLNKDCEIQ